jgi:Fuc2NAc and GlcNAc transferase
MSLATAAVLGFAATALGIAAYARVARTFRIVAVPNERTLHAAPTVRGGGVVVAIVFLAGVLVQWLAGELFTRWFLALFAGGAAIATLGFVDDIVHLSTRLRLCCHLALAAWATGCIGDALGWGIPGELLAMVATVWMINLFNFMDGIDGMAGSGSLFFAVVSVVLLGWADATLSMTFALLAAASLGFLLFNWPPARLFMGDSGSGFYGYTFAVLAMITIEQGRISLWTWLIVLGYFVGDTTTTVVLRAARVPQFWGTHRSHAYQNLARVWNDHLRMTLLVCVVHAGWLFPLALASATWPALGPIFAATALAPIVRFAVKFGPLYAG